MPPPPHGAAPPPPHAGDLEPLAPTAAIPGTMALAPAVDGRLGRLQANLTVGSGKPEPAGAAARGRPPAGDLDR